MKLQHEVNLALGGQDQRNRSEQEVPPDRAEALLTSIIKFSIPEWVEVYGSDIRETYNVIMTEERKLCEAVGITRVLTLCEEIHRGRCWSIRMARITLFPIKQ